MRTETLYQRMDARATWALLTVLLTCLSGCLTPKDPGPDMAYLRRSDSVRASFHLQVVNCGQQSVQIQIDENPPVSLVRSRIFMLPQETHAIRVHFPKAEGQPAPPEASLNIAMNASAVLTIEDPAKAAASGRELLAVKAPPSHVLAELYPRPGQRPGPVVTLSNGNFGPAVVTVDDYPAITIPPQGRADVLMPGGTHQLKVVVGPSALSGLTAPLRKALPPSPVTDGVEIHGSLTADSPQEVQVHVQGCPKEKPTGLYIRKPWASWTEVARHAEGK